VLLNLLNNSGFRYSIIVYLGYFRQVQRSSFSRSVVFVNKHLVSGASCTRTEGVNDFHRGQRYAFVPTKTGRLRSSVAVCPLKISTRPRRRLGGVATTISLHIVLAVPFPLRVRRSRRNLYDTVLFVATVQFF